MDERVLRGGYIDPAAPPRPSPFSIGVSIDRSVAPAPAAVESVVPSTDKMIP